MRTSRARTAAPEATPADSAGYSADTSGTPAGHSAGPPADDPGDCGGPGSSGPATGNSTGSTGNCVGNLAERTATDLRAALGPLVRRLRQFRPDGELTLSQTSALVRLDREGPATASELAAAEGIRPQSMCTIVAALQELGLVERAQDPYDGRRMVVSVTSAGFEGLHGARRERARRLTVAITEELTPAEQEQLAAAIPLLERITRRV